MTLSICQHQILKNHWFSEGHELNYKGRFCLTFFLPSSQQKKIMLCEYTGRLSNMT